MTHPHDIINEQHRADCGECRQLWAELDAISAEAAQLPALSPSRDLWSGIESRIGGETTTASAPVLTSPKWYRAQGFRLAMAASLLVAVTSAVTWQVAKAPNTDAIVAASPESGVAPTEEYAVHLAAFSASVTQMDNEIATLQQIVTERRRGLDPKTVEVLESNLAVIDAAIRESRAALEADPASQFLAAQFTRAYTSKLTLLRDAATLPVGI